MPPVHDFGSWDVIVCGYGPVGGFVSLLLARYGLRVLLCERETTPYAAPRAVSLNDECVRSFGLASPRLAARVDAHTSKAAVDIRNGSSASSWPQAWSIVGPAPPRVIPHTGYSDTVFFHQPTLERIIRASVEGYADRVQVVCGWGVTSLSQVDAHDVTVSMKQVEGGAPGVARGRLLLGCDGGSSTVRRGVQVDFQGDTFPDQPWLVVDVTSTDAALLHTWRHFNFIADYRRPLVHVPLPGGEGGRRFEFMLLPGEDATAMQRPEAYHALLRSIGVDPASLQVVRVVVYTFHARCASAWRVGNVLLLGDAAHCMPPFRGQGMCAGMRDAATAAWRVATVVQRGARCSEVLASYEAERRSHVQELTGKAVMMGKLITLRWRVAAAVRDAVIAAVAQNPVTGPLIKDPFTPSTALQHGLFDFHTWRGRRARQQQQGRVALLRGWQAREGVTGMEVPNYTVAVCPPDGGQAENVMLDAALHGLSGDGCPPCWVILASPSLAAAGKSQHPLTREALGREVAAVVASLHSEGVLRIVQLLPLCGGEARVAASRSGQGTEAWMPACDAAWLDASPGGKWQEYFSNARADVVIVRPDRFVYGAYEAREVRTGVQYACALLRGEDATGLTPVWLRSRAPWALQAVAAFTDAVGDILYACWMLLASMSVATWLLLLIVIAAVAVASGWDAHAVDGVTHIAHHTCSMLHRHAALQSLTQALCVMAR